MALHVLGVGYSYDGYGTTATMWSRYNIEFDFADSIRHATAMLSYRNTSVLLFALMLYRRMIWMHCAVSVPRQLL